MQPAALPAGTAAVAEPSSAAAGRMRASRERRRAGKVMVTLEVTPSFTELLATLGWLAPDRQTDKSAVTEALIGFMQAAGRASLSSAEVRTVLSAPNSSVSESHTK